MLSEPWYTAYKEAWSTIENTVEVVNQILRIFLIDS